MQVTTLNIAIRKTSNIKISIFTFKDNAITKIVLTCCITLLIKPGEKINLIYLNCLIAISLKICKFVLFKGDLRATFYLFFARFFVAVVNFMGKESCTKFCSDLTNFHEVIKLQVLDSTKVTSSP